jgi:hypothetical protein
MLAAVRTPFLVGLISLSHGCGSGDPGPGDAPIRFTDVTEVAGLPFRYTFGDFAYDNILESSGSGAAFFDYDGDDDMDLLLLNGRYLEDISDPKGRGFAGATSALYRNDGGGSFTDVTEAAGLAASLWGMAPAIADFDGDGHEDLFLANYGPNVFYHNDGDGGFTDRTAELGLAGPVRINGFTKWSVGAAPFDADGDGDLDLLVGNFLAFDPYRLSPNAPERMPAPADYEGQQSIYYRREADGRYVEATAEAGLLFPQNKVMGLTAFDADGDGDVDLFQANDHQPNFLLVNDGAGRFVEQGLRAGLAVNMDGLGTGSMHGSLGDADGNGLVDVFVTDLRYGSLHRNLGDGKFDDICASSGVRAALHGAEAWGGGLHDFDNDGDLDLFTTNGGADRLILKLPTLLANDGTGRFRDVAPSAGSYFSRERSGRGAAFGDFDDDGDIDILVSHVDLEARPALLRNDTDNGNHWLGIRLEPSHGASEPVGAVVLVTAGGRTQVRVHQRAQSYLSQNDPRLHFGLGSASSVERIEVRWPQRGTQTLQNVPADAYLTIVEGDRKSPSSDV